jgi:hypothetical protein
MQKFSMKKLVCAVAVAGACASANAATVDLGALPIGETFFDGQIVGGPAPISFGHFFTFELPASGKSTYTVLNFPVPAFNANLAFASLALFSMGSDNAIGGAAGTPAEDILLAKADGLVGTGSNKLALSLGPRAAPESMYLFVSGFTTGSAGGLYYGGINVSPVPEPEAWAMMLIGAGLVGFRLRNRSKKTAAQRFA